MFKKKKKERKKERKKSRMSCIYWNAELHFLRRQRQPQIYCPGNNRVRENKDGGQLTNIIYIGLRLAQACADNLRDRARAFMSLAMSVYALMEIETETVYLNASLYLTFKNMTRMVYILRGICREFVFNQKSIGQLQLSRRDGQ